MTHNTKQGLIVIGIVFIPAIIMASVWFSLSAKREMAAGVNSAKHSMAQSYDKMVASKSNGITGVGLQVSFDELRAAFCDQNGQLKFSSYIPAEQIWLSRQPASLKSNKLLCVVNDGRNAFGLDVSGKVRDVSPEEFAKWPHVQTAPTTSPPNRK